MKSKLSCLLFAGLLTLWGCGGPVISREIREAATPISGFAEIRQHPDKFKGKTVIVGGQIIATRGQENESTTLIVLALPLDDRERPEKWDNSEGRFMVDTGQFLDPEVYAEGREVTVAGTVTGVKVAPVGKTQYRYVVIKPRQIYLWPYRYPGSAYPPYPDRYPSEEYDRYPQF